MKKLPFFLLLLFAISGFSFNAPYTDDLPAEEVQCGTTILSGCVGACGNGFKIATTAPATGFYCYEAVSSLCPTNGAQAVVEINGNGIFSGDVSGGLNFSFFANAGDEIKIAAELFDKKTDIVCVWLGQVNITVREP